MKLLVVAPLLSLILVATTCRLSSAFFTGENGCAEGEGAGDLESIAGSQRIPFEESGVQFIINGQLLEEDTDIILEADGDYNFAVAQAEGDSGRTFVGGLIRVTQNNADDAFTFGPLQAEGNIEPDSQAAEACEAPVAGVTSLESGAEQTSLTGRFVSTSPEDVVTVDVTIVLTNATETEPLTYTYTQYSLRTTTPPPSNDTDTENEPNVPVPAPPDGFNTLRPSVTLFPTVTSAPSFPEVCDICGSADLAITLPNATVEIGTLRSSCSVVEGFSRRRLIPPQGCEVTVAEVTANCGCAPINGTAATNGTEPIGEEVDEGSNTTSTSGSNTTDDGSGNSTEVPGSSNETLTDGGNSTDLDSNATDVPSGNSTDMGNATEVPSGNSTDMGNATEVPGNSTAMGNATEAPGNLTDMGNATEVPGNATGMGGNETDGNSTGTTGNETDVGTDDINATDSNTTAPTSAPAEEQDEPDDIPEPSSNGTNTRDIGSGAVAAASVTTMTLLVGSSAMIAFVLSSVLM